MSRSRHRHGNRRR